MPATIVSAATAVYLTMPFEFDFEFAAHGVAGSYFFHLVANAYRAWLHDGCIDSAQPQLLATLGVDELHRLETESIDELFATHVRNRENIEQAGELIDRVRYIDNEYIAAPMHRLATLLRGGEEVAWSTNAAWWSY